MVKVALAGGTGGLGREVVDALFAKNRHEIIVLTRQVAYLHLFYLVFEPVMTCSLGPGAVYSAERRTGHSAGLHRQRSDCRCTARR